MALNLYLDDCADSNLLVDLLRQAGHTVVRPRDAGITGEDDDVHLAYAVGHNLILVTKNPQDLVRHLVRRLVSSRAHRFPGRPSAAAAGRRRAIRVR